MKNKILTCVLIIVMLFSSFNACAVQGEKSDTSEKINTENNTETITAKSPHAILMDMKTGAIIYKRVLKVRFILRH